MTKKTKQAAKGNAITAYLMTLVGNLLNNTADPEKAVDFYMLANHCPAIMNCIGQDRNGPTFQLRTRPKTSAMQLRRKLTPDAHLQRIPDTLYEQQNLFISAELPMLARSGHRKGGTVQDYCKQLLTGLNFGVIRNAKNVTVALVNEARGNDRINNLKDFSAHIKRGAGDVMAPPEVLLRMQDKVPPNEVMDRLRAHRDICGHRLYDFIRSRDPDSNVIRYEFVNFKDLRNMTSTNMYNAIPYCDISVGLKIDESTDVISHEFDEDPPQSAKVGEAELAIIRSLNKSEGQSNLHSISVVADTDFTIALSFIIDDYPAQADIVRQLRLLPDPNKPHLIQYWDELSHCRSLVRQGDIGKRMKATCQPALLSVIDWLAGCSDYTFALSGVSSSVLREAITSIMKEDGFPAEPWFPDLNTPSDVRALKLEHLAMMLFAFYFQKYKAQHKYRSLADLWLKSIESLEADEVTQNDRNVFVKAVSLSNIFTITLGANKKRPDLYLPHTGTLLACAGHTRQQMDFIIGQLLHNPPVLRCLKKENGFDVDDQRRPTVTVNLITGAFVDVDGKLHMPNTNVIITPAVQATPIPTPTPIAHEGQPPHGEPNEVETPLLVPLQAATEDLQGTLLQALRIRGGLGEMEEEEEEEKVDYQIDDEENMSNDELSVNDEHLRDIEDDEETAKLEREEMEELDDDDSIIESSDDDDDDDDDVDIDVEDGEDFKDDI